VAPYINSFILISAEQNNPSIKKLKEEGLTVLMKPINETELYKAMINILKIPL